jgi:hypothetical protein
MPSVVTLDDLTAMMAADEHHRYEISPEGEPSPNGLSTPRPAFPSTG